MSDVDIYGVPGGLKESFGPVLSLKQLWVIVWAHRYLIVIVPVLFGMAAIGVVKFVLPKIYEARTTLFVAYKGGDSLSAGDDMVGNDLWGFVTTQIELMRSAGTLMPAVEKLALHELEPFSIGYVGDGSEDSRIRHAASILNTRLIIQPGAGTRFIYLMARDENPEFAATLANTVADVYLDVQLKQIVDPVNERIQRYSEQIESLRVNVESAQARVAEFRQRTGLLSLRESADPEGGRLRDLEQRLGQASAQRQAAQARLQRIRQGDTTMVNAPLVASLRTQIQAGETQLLEQGQSLGPRHPTMVALQAETAHLKAQLDRELQTSIASAVSEVNSLSTLEKDLERQVELQRGEVMSTRKQQDEGSRLMQALDSASKVYQTALDSFERAQFGTQMAVTNINIISRATPPARHVGGNRKKILLAIGLGGGLAGAGCLLYELLNRRIRCREDLEYDLNLPVLMELRPAR